MEVKVNKICDICKKEFSVKIEIDGKQRNLQNRKFCLTCSPFGNHNTSKDPPKIGESKESRAKKCKNKKGVVYRKRIKQKLIKMYGGKCIVCGYNKNEFPSAFAFHHKNPEEKEFKIAGCSISIKNLIEECKECQLLCVRCHAEIHDSWDRKTEKYPIPKF